MQRREATLLLREINNYPDVTPFSCIYLKPHRRSCDSENLELHIKIHRDPSTRRIIENIASKHKLLTKEEPDGFLVIYTPERELLKITA